MQKYVDRLIRCGYKPDRAKAVCEDFLRNLSLPDLDYFVRSVERQYYVDKIQSEPYRQKCG